MHCISYACHPFFHEAETTISLSNTNAVDVELMQMKQLSSFFLQILLSLHLTFQAQDYLVVIMLALGGMRYFGLLLCVVSHSATRNLTARCF